MRLLTVIGALLIGVFASSGAEVAPGAAAVSFLEDVQGTTLSIDEILEKTVLSPFCGDERRMWIEKQLQELRVSLRVGELEFRVVGEKEDGGFAGVLVAVVPEGDPFTSKVVPVALRYTEEAWVPAPVVGSFANANVGFDQGVRNRVKVLERWMGRQRVIRMRDLYLDAVAALEKRMEEVVSDELLVEGTAKEVMKGFLDACGRKDLAAVLVFLGADSGQADEATSPQAIVTKGLRGEDEMGRWALLTSPDVVRVVAESREERSETVVSVLFYDTESVTGAKLLNFSLNKDSDRWQVDLPRVLREAFNERRPWRTPAASEHKMRRRFSEYFEESRVEERFDDSRAMGERMVEVLREGTLEEFFVLLSRNEGFAEGERVATYEEAADLWNEFRERGRHATHGVLVDVMEEGSAAAVVLHLVTTAELDRLELVTVFLVREESGWAIAPGVTSLGNWETMPRQESLDQKEVLMRYARRKAGLEKVAAERFLKEFAEVEVGVKKEVSEEEARRLVEEFRERLRAGDLPRAFECCALLDRSEGAWEGLKSLTYEYRGVQQAKQADRELNIQTKGSWAGVSLRLDTGSGGDPDYPLYLVRSTAEGPRIVVDAGLRMATNKGRKILNEQVWEHLDAHLVPEEVGLVREVFGGHLEHCNTDYAEWQKSTKSSR